MQTRVLNPTSLNEFAQVLSNVQRVLIVAHVDPDGDAIGSTLGLAWALRARGLRADVTCQDAPPDTVGFLPGVDEFTSRGPEDEDDLVIAIDTGDLRRMGRHYIDHDLGGRSLVVIDHHMTNPHFGDINLIADVPATAMLVLEAIDHLEIPLDDTIATCLLTGIITDTQGFRTSNTTPDALAMAQRLMVAGARMTQINQWVFFRRAAAILPVWGAALSGATLSQGVLWAELPLDLQRQHGVGGGASSGLVNFFSTVREAGVAMLLTEQADGIIDVSLRSKPGVNVSGVAQAFGGGGHPQAAGCQVSGKLAEVREDLLKALHALLDESA
jgi:bifunctional oligoribonuclease and PAP phosphatase NrnA